ncbi:MAG: hypothetical protein ABFD70_03570 [Syntrophaceae bacterium]|nr:hypothetical protein [Deltaproteobacteria bacterium]
MKVLVSIDDTDNLESRGTGHLASDLVVDIEKKGWGKGSFVTRHQLFVHPDVPYTSHNSSMCFIADIGHQYLDSLVEHASMFLEKESATGSDPGLCVAVLDRLQHPTEIIDYGKRAKRQIITKAEAREMASRNGIHLSEHGGTGGGIIGALAGIGLRLSGNDGRVKGKLFREAAGKVLRVGEILTQSHVDMVKSIGGDPMHSDEFIRLGEKVKAVFLDGRSVLLVVPEKAPSDGVYWRTIPRQDLNGY